MLPAAAIDAVEGLPVPLEHILREVFELYEARSPEQLVKLLRRRYRRGSGGMESAAAPSRSLHCRRRSCCTSLRRTPGRTRTALLLLPVADCLLPLPTESCCCCCSKDAVFIDPTMVAKPRREVALAFFALQ
jgi:hypothetical protein